MFDGGVSEVVSDVVDERAASYEAEWQSVHRTLRAWAKQCAELDAAGNTYLLEAEHLHVFKRLGYRSMVEYMVGALGFTRHAANERLRVARELLTLPKLAAAYEEGTLCFSKVRELSRVVTPATEEAFIAEATTKDSHQVAKLVSGLRRGDPPDAVPDPALVTRRVSFELHAEALALLAARKTELKDVLGHTPTDDELITALCTGAVAPDPRAIADEQAVWETAPGDDSLARKAAPTSGTSWAACEDSPRTEAPVVIAPNAEPAFGPTGDAREDRPCTDPPQVLAPNAEPAFGPTQDAREDKPRTDPPQVLARMVELARGPTWDARQGVSRSEVTELITRDVDASRPRRTPAPRSRQLLVTCKHCARSELLVNGEALAINAPTAALLTCDVELAGDADCDELTRVTSKIPQALRRKVFMRDKFRWTHEDTSALESFVANPRDARNARSRCSEPTLAIEGTG